jgi:hypothetical protein
VRIGLRVKGRIDRAILETLVEAGEKATAKVEAKAKAPDGRRDRAKRRIRITD